MKRILLFLPVSVACLCGFAQYCHPVYTQQTGHFINYFQFNSLQNYKSYQNFAGDTVYSEADYTTYVTIGSTCFCQAATIYGNPPGGTFAVWIDYNHDSTYSQNELVLSSADHVEYASGYITIPNDTAITGLARMRVLMAWDWNGMTPGPCDSCIDGESEEYYIHITDSIVSPEYCIPVLLGAQDVHFAINNFKLNDLHNCGSAAENDGYILYPDSMFTTDLEIGKTYNITVNPYPSTANTGYCVFIDYNDDYAFDAGEIVYSVWPSSYPTGKISIPNDSSLTGKHRLRIRSRMAGYPGDPCGWVLIGETEDYFVNIVPAVIDTTQIPANLWDMVYPTTLSNYQFCRGITETYDKGYMLSIDAVHTVPHIRLMKVSIDGDVRWSKEFMSYDGFWATGMDTTLDGGIILAGFQQGTDPAGDSYALKLDACAEPEWVKFFGIPGNADQMHEVFHLPDSGYIVSATNLGPVFSDTLGWIGLMRLDKDGNIKWFRDQSYYYHCELGSFIVTDDGGYLITGNAYTPDPDNIMGYYLRRSMLIKTDSSGQLQWKRTYGGPQKIYGIGNSSAEVPGSGYLTLCSLSDSTSSMPRMSLYKSDALGNVSWAKPLTPDTFEHFTPRYIKRMGDDLYVIAANRYDDCDIYDTRMSVFLVDSSGNMLSSRIIGDFDCWLQNFGFTSGHKILLAGSKISYNQHYDTWIMKLNPDLSTDTFYSISLVYDSLCDSSLLVMEKLPAKGDLIANILPNPTSGLAVLKLGNYSGQPYDVKICNMEGMTVKRYAACRSSSLEIDLRGVKPGLYLISVITEDHDLLVKKIIVFPDDR